MTESFEIQSDATNMPIVEERLFHFCHLCNVGNYYAVVAVATLQAVENAMLHGNGGDSSKMVDVNFGRCRGGIFVEVADQGQGFDFESYGTLPTGEEEKGEGIFVMKSLADNLVFSDGGRRVRMEFMVAGIDPADSMQRVACLRQCFSLEVA